MVEVLVLVIVCSVTEDLRISFAVAILNAFEILKHGLPDVFQGLRLTFQRTSPVARYKSDFTGQNKFFRHYPQFY